MTPKQSAIFDAIIDAVANNVALLTFVDSKAG